MPTNYQLTINTPLGKMVAKANDNAVFALDFVSCHCGLNYSHLVVSNSPPLVPERSRRLEGLGVVQYPEKQEIPAYAEMTDNPNNILLQLATELDEYFAGKRRVFSIPVLLQGTDFQKKAWQILQQIPYGKTISYTEQAMLVGNKKAVRAVANANSKNKIVLLVPCHRVIGSNGALTGFASGLWRKKRLIELEKN